MLGYQTKEFPGFFTNLTGCLSPAIATCAEHVARIMTASQQLGLLNGMMVAVPNPSPPADQDLVSQCIEQAIKNAESSGIQGAAITPYLLSAGIITGLFV